jgi:hypothetical protein
VSEEPKRIRIWVNKVEYDKIDKNAKKTGMVAGNRVVDILMAEHVKKEKL